MSVSAQIATHRLRLRLGKVCVAITGSSPETLIGNSLAHLREFPFQELRLDSLPDPLSAIAPLRAHVGAHGGATFLATCRRKPSGGNFTGSPRAELEILLEAARAGVALVDLAVESAEVLPIDAVSRLREAGAAVVLSCHDFEHTGDLRRILQLMSPFSPDIYKIVPTAGTLSDNLTLLRFISKAIDERDLSMVGLSMGEAGILSRVLGVRAGSAFTFAAASQAEATAPGQIAARTLRELYRIESVDPATRVYGVAGDPIGSSLSPLMLNTAFRRETVNAVYVPLLTRDAQDLFRVARELPLAGFSVTMPLKQAVIPFLERTDPLSSRIGAVNTVLRGLDSKFYGFNTDVAGILGPLERRLKLRGARVLVIGAGGAARAAVFACADRGAEVCIVNRTHENAVKLAKQAKAKAIRREAIAKLPGFDVVINATPAGMSGNSTELFLHPDELRTRWIFDLVYNPLETPLLRAARARGIDTISGVEMFVHQGARQFEIWTGKPAPAEEMLRVVVHALTQRSQAAAQGSEESAHPAFAAPFPAVDPRGQGSDSHSDPEPAAGPPRKSTGDKEPTPPSAEKRAAPPKPKAAPSSPVKTKASKPPPPSKPSSKKR